MTQQEIIGFVGFSLVSAFTPGPSNVMVAAAGAVGGLYRGFLTLLGVAAGMASLIFILAVGLGQTVLASETGLLAMKGFGAVFLLGLSWKIATADPEQNSGDRAVVGPLSAALFQWVNPKSWVVGAGAVGTYFNSSSSRIVMDAALLAGLFLICCIPSLTAWLLRGSSLESALKNPPAARTFNRVMGVLLASSVVMMFV